TSQCSRIGRKDGLWFSTFQWGWLRQWLSMAKVSSYRMMLRLVTSGGLLEQTRITPKAHSISPLEREISPDVSSPRLPSFFLSLPFLRDARRTDPGGKECTGQDLKYSS